MKERMEEMKEERLGGAALDKLTEVIRHYSELDQKTLRALVDHIPVQTFRKGEVLIEQGEVPRRCYFVIEGCARKFSVDEDGKEVTSDFYTEEQSINVFTDNPKAESPYSVVCLENSIMIVGDLEEEQNELEMYPEFESIILKMMQAGMGELQDTFASFIRMTPEERVRHMMGKRPELFTRVPQHQLASYLGLTPESLSRIKGRLGQGPLKAVD
ncbi:Crp/Fnr family transcriptional regulator [Proteiniclasticum sp. SCR006]|uniref:Crp/Fnr family transcriptional regulator n=1 Tax=Proteiniclasticum aestuarii TaxID=2817862 RepID=A0A939KH65_9CLOT|nr:Crp/Fnr family transcriptional regulator [Proteiniclasticum aestuarii]MBO1266262.1 Crp/Fnr family transcriptional regulator [Proteiniclasticum aestuarii]